MSEGLLGGSETLTITPLGAGAEVGRSCILLRFKGKTVMLDCGVHPAHSGMAALPFFDEVDPATVDLVLVTHFHLDHAAALPYWMEKTTFRGRVYMTHPTKAIYKWLLADYVRVSGAAEDAADDPQQLYSEADLIRSYERISAVDYHQEVEVDGIRFVALNAGHVLGAAMFMVEIAGVRVLYTGDYSREEDRHLMAAETPAVPPDVLVCESTYGVHSHQPRLEREARFVGLVHEVVARGGRCLIPVFALGRAQELLLILDEYWQAHPELHKVPVYYASSLARKCMAVYQTYVNMMNERIRRQIAVANPFLFRHIKYLRGIEQFTDDGPCVMMASPAMLQSGLSRQLLEAWAPSPRNGLVIPGYVVEGTLAKHILSEPADFVAASGATLPLKMTVEYISFSAHVDFAQNSEFIDLLRPPHLVLVHGEANEMLRLKAALQHRYGLSEKTTAQPAAFLIGGAAALDDEGRRRLLNIHTPRNGESVELGYRGERIIKVVGSLGATLSRRHTGGVLKAGADDSASGLHGEEHDVIEGVLVGKDFEYQLVAPQDLHEYVQGIRPVEVRERQALTCRAPFSLVEHLLSQLFGPRRVKRVGEHDLVVDGRFSVQCDGHSSYIVEWPGNPMNDLLADSIVMLLLGADSSRLSVKASKGSDRHHHEHHGHHVHAAPGVSVETGLSDERRQAMMQSFLEHQYGSVQVATDADGAAVYQFDLDGVPVSVGRADHAVHCADRAVRDRVDRTLHKIVSLLDPDYVI